jgi:hypothetical protein
MFGLSCSVPTCWHRRTQVRNLAPHPPKPVSSLAPLNKGRIVNAWRAAGFLALTLGSRLTGALACFQLPRRNEPGASVPGQVAPQLAQILTEPRA